MKEKKEGRLRRERERKRERIASINERERKRMKKESREMTLCWRPPKVFNDVVDPLTLLRSHISSLFLLQKSFQVCYCGRIIWPFTWTAHSLMPGKSLRVSSSFSLTLKRSNVHTHQVSLPLSSSLPLSCTISLSLSYFFSLSLRMFIICPSN